MGLNLRTSIVGSVAAGLLGAGVLVACSSGSNAPHRAKAPVATSAPGANAHSAKTVPKKRKVEYWVAPMNPNYRSDKPGKSPMGMDLVPVYADADDSGLVKIDPVVVQDIGVRIARVERRDLSRKVRTVGAIEPAENLLSVVNLRFSGWIEKLYVDETGVLVKRGQALFDVYSPELYSAEQEYLVALKTTGADSSLTHSADIRLRLYGLAGWQIAALNKSRVPHSELTVTAPRTGYVLHKSVVEGAHVKAGTDVFHIADLSTVWIEAQVYEEDAPFITLGAPATARLTFEPGKTYHGGVSFIYPTLDPRSRTLRVRIALPNPDLTLKPNAFATVYIKAQRKKNVLVIPSESVIRSGTRELVFVVHGLGHYEARQVVTGVVGDDDLTEVRQGLQEGERVVTSGQFLLDSESQLQEAVQKMMKKNLEVPPSAPQASAASPAAPAK